MWIHQINLQPGRSVLGRPRVHYPTVADGDQLIGEMRDPHGLITYHDRTSRAGTEEECDQGITLYLVHRGTRSESIALYASGVAVDAHRSRWDVILEAGVRIQDGTGLLSAGIASVIDPHTPLTGERLASWLTDRAQVGLADRLAGRSYEELSDPIKTPFQAWERWLREVLAEWKLDATLARLPNWRSEDAELLARRATAQARKDEVIASQKAEADLRRQVEQAEAAKQEDQRIAREEREQEERRSAIQSHEWRQLLFRQKKVELENQRTLEDLYRALRSAEEDGHRKTGEWKLALLGLDARRLEITSALAKQARIEEERRQEEEDRRRHAREASERDQKTGPAHRDALHENSQSEALIQSETKVIEAEAKKAAAQARIEDLRRDEEKKEAQHRLVLQQIERASKANAAFGSQESAEVDGVERGTKLAQNLLRELTSGVYRPGDIWLQAEALGVHPELYALWQENVGSTGASAYRTVRFTEGLIVAARTRATRFSVLRVGAEMMEATPRNLVGGGEIPPLGKTGDQAFAVPVVRIGARHGFRLLAPREGHVTLINPGTSGDFYLLTPNDDAPSIRAKRGDLLEVPGRLIPKGLPAQAGPPGEETLVALVTAEPLFTAEELAAPDETGGLTRWDPCSRTDVVPFRHIAGERIDALEERLLALPPRSWAVGVLKYLVIPQSTP